MTSEKPLLSPAEIEKFNALFLDWYEKMGRSYLPWRKDRTPYGTWVSEIMLQQTQVDTVIPYFENFMTKFPTLKALAQAPQEEVLKNWEGLGYYSRARNLQAGAKEVLTHFNGKIPETYEELLSLKGIGPYTAGAIASMAFQQPVAAIDGNTMRVFARLFEISEDISLLKTQKKFKIWVEEIISQTRPGDFNQALMDLGSSICTPKNPQCLLCPLKEFCQSQKDRRQGEFPVKTKKVKAKPVFYVALALENGQQEFYLQQRGSSGLLANFWHFPLVEVTKAEYQELLALSKIPEQQLENLVAEEDFSKTQALLAEKFKETVPHFTQVILQKRNLGEIQHVFSHLKWQVLLFYGRMPDKYAKDYVNLAETKLPLPKAQHKLMALLGKNFEKSAD